MLIHAKLRDGAGRRHPHTHILALEVGLLLLHFHAQFVRPCDDHHDIALAVTSIHIDILCTIHILPCMLLLCHGRSHCQASACKRQHHLHDVGILAREKNSALASTVSRKAASQRQESRALILSLDRRAWHSASPRSKCLALQVRARSTLPG